MTSINQKLQDIINQCLESTLKTAGKLRELLDRNKDEIVIGTTVKIQALLDCVMTRGTGVPGASALESCVHAFLPKEKEHTDEAVLLLQLLQDKTEEISPLLQIMIEQIPYEASTAALADVMAQAGQEPEHYLSALKEKIDAVLASQESQKKIQSAQIDVMNQIIRDLISQISTVGISDSETDVSGKFRELDRLSAFHEAISTLVHKNLCSKENYEKVKSNPNPEECANALVANHYHYQPLLVDIMGRLSGAGINEESERLADLFQTFASLRSLIRGVELLKENGRLSQKTYEAIKSDANPEEKAQALIREYEIIQKAAEEIQHLLSEVQIEEPLESVMSYSLDLEKFSCFADAVKILSDLGLLTQYPELKAVKNPKVFIKTHLARKKILEQQARYLIRFISIDIPSLTFPKRLSELEVFVQALQILHDADLLHEEEYYVAMQKSQFPIEYAREQKAIADKHFARLTQDEKLRLNALAVKLREISIIVSPKTIERCIQNVEDLDKAIDFLLEHKMSCRWDELCFAENTVEMVQNKYRDQQNKIQNEMQDKIVAVNSLLTKNEITASLPINKIADGRLWKLKRLLESMQDLSDKGMLTQNHFYDLIAFKDKGKFSDFVKALIMIDGTEAMQFYEEIKKEVSFLACARSLVYLREAGLPLNNDNTDFLLAESRRKPDFFPEVIRAIARNKKLTREQKENIFSAIRQKRRQSEDDYMDNVYELIKSLQQPTYYPIARLQEARRYTQKDESGQEIIEMEWHNRGFWVTHEVAADFFDFQVFSKIIDFAIHHEELLKGCQLIQAAYEFAKDDLERAEIIKFGKAYIHMEDFAQKAQEYHDEIMLKNAGNQQKEKTFSLVQEDASSQQKREAENMQREAELQRRSLEYLNMRKRVDERREKEKNKREEEEKKLEQECKALDQEEKLRVEQVREARKQEREEEAKRQKTVADALSQERARQVLFEQEREKEAPEILKPAPTRPAAPAKLSASAPAFVPNRKSVATGNHSGAASSSMWKSSSPSSTSSPVNPPLR